MATQNVKIDLIDDNPYQSILRPSYSNTKIDEFAYSFTQVGMRHTPEARKVGERFQLAHGHCRKRAFAKLIRHTPKDFPHKATLELVKAGVMPLEVKTFTDMEMLQIAIEENLRRSDTTTMSFARGIGLFLDTFKKETVTSAAAKFNLTQGAVSNMLRVLKCPPEILEKIDSGKINFTMARELLVFQGKHAKGEDTDWHGGKEKKIPKDEKWLMLQAIKKIGGSYGPAATVDGIKKAIYEVAKSNFPALEKAGSYWHSNLEPLFDTRSAGCLKCEHSITCYETKSQARHYCTNQGCWEQRQEVHKREQAKKAKQLADAAVKKQVAEMEQARAAAAAPPETPAETISQEIPSADYKLEKRFGDWIAVDNQGLIIAIGTDKAGADTRAKAYFEPVETVLNPTAQQNQLNHTFRIITKQGVKQPELNGESLSDVTAQDLPTALAAMGLKPDDVQEVKVYKSSGKESTAGGVGAGWSKYTGPMAIAAPATAPAESQVEAAAAEPEPPAKPEAPAKIKAAAKDQAGTRAEVLDLRDLKSGNYGDLKHGYVHLNPNWQPPLECMEDPEECTQRCTKGFHYGFDSSETDGKVLFICSDPKCVSRKKAAFTRAKNAAGQAKKNAELAGIREAVDKTTGIDKPRMLLIIEAEMLGRHVRSYSYSRSDTKDVLLKILGIQKEDQYEREEDTVKKIRTAMVKMSEEQLAKVIVEFMLRMFIYDGDIQNYKAQTTAYLNLMGVGVNVDKKEGDKAPADKFPDGGRAGQPV